VIGIAQQNIGPVARTLSGSIALTVAAVPTGMKAGVRISPRGCVDHAGAGLAVGGGERKGKGSLPSPL
jgi:hypothetical protein